jgi:hypothetical protein
MLLIIPLFAGLLACMPVPIGDPERSRIDPELSGIWAVLGEEGAFDESGFYVFEPYDKRTWLVSGGPLVEGENSDNLPEIDMTTYDGWIELAAIHPVDKDYVRMEKIVVYKAWLKKLGGELFMTWEPKLILEDGIPEPEVWFTYRIVKKGSDRLEMQLVNGESDLFDDVKETRRAFEKVISRNATDPELYFNDEDIDVTLARVQDTELEFFEELLQTVISWD